MSKVRLTGSTSGYTEIQASAVAGDNTLSLPTTTDGTLLAADSSGNVNLDNGIVISQSAGNYTLDTSPGAVVVANNGTVDFANASGVLFVNSHTSGAVTIWLVGAGFTSAIGNVNGTVGTMSWVNEISGYRWTNNSGSSDTVSFMFFRTRTQA